MLPDGVRFLLWSGPEDVWMPALASPMRTALAVLASLAVACVLATPSAAVAAPVRGGSPAKVAGPPARGVAASARVGSVVKAAGSPSQGGGAAPTAARGAQASSPKPPSLGPFMRGMTYAAYTATVFASATSDEQVRAMARAGVNAISVQTAWYQQSPTSTRIAPTAQTPSDASLEHLIRLAHSLHMRVFLDPFVNAIHGEAWQGAFHPTSWAAWFRSYDAMVAHYATLAQATGVNMLSLGDENDTSDHTPALLPYYLHMVAIARRDYHGALTYGADYPDYRQVPAAFWRSLDAIGLEAYFPLAGSTDPTQAQLDASWRRQVAAIAAWRRAEGLTAKPVVLTEIGYYSGATTAANPGAWEPNARLDLALQVACYRAVFTTMYQQPWLQGIFWFWWANPSDGPDWPPLATNNGYNVQNKPVLGLIESYYRAPGGGRAVPPPVGFRR